MDGIVCDRCGDGLLVDEDARYVMNLEIFAAYDPMEITQNDLDQDLDAEFESALQALAGADSEELQRQVHYQASFDLCGKCRRGILQDPLFRSGRK